MSSGTSNSLSERSMALTARPRTESRLVIPGAFAGFSAPSLFHNIPADRKGTRRVLTRCSQRVDTPHADALQHIRRRNALETDI